MKLGFISVSALCLAIFGATPGCTTSGGDHSQNNQNLVGGSSCVVGKDCPVGQGCASDGKCHVDGECVNEWQPDGTYASADCTAGQICAASGAQLDGFCTDGRGAHDPYCRADGQGACRIECTSADECGQGACIAGYCHPNDECQTNADCSPNHHCANPAGWDAYGFMRCMEDETPTCVNDGQGACRLQCNTGADCLEGGGCSADHLCHASNECHTTADCNPSEICYPDSRFGGLCGPTR